MPHLGVNIDHVATVRQARGVSFPDPVEAALACERAGADSIVAHLREDRRHIQDRDLVRIKEKLRIKFNVEMSIDPGVVRAVLGISPGGVTFVPERRQEKTTEAGLDVLKSNRNLGRAIERFKKKGVGVSLFVDPSEKQIRAAHALDADAVEIHTGAYANATRQSERERLAQEIDRAIQWARGLGLLGHVGHGLNYENVRRIARIQGISEFNIGFSIIARALFVGLAQAVREMKRLIAP